MPNFNSLRRLEVAFFGRFLSRFYGRHYRPLFRKLACELAEVTLEAHLRPNTFIRLLAARDLTVVEGRFPANCLLYGLEIFVAAAVIKGITCVVQCYNNKSNQPSWYFAPSKPCERTRNGKMNNFCNHTVQISSREVFLSAVLITSRTSVSRGLFMSKDPRGRLFHCPFQVYGKKDPEKTRRKVPNLNAVEVIVCFFFNTSTIEQNLFFLLTYFKVYFSCGKPLAFSSAVC